MASFSIESSKLRQFIDSINFDHFLVLTDETGMLQHSKFRPAVTSSTNGKQDNDMSKLETKVERL